MSITISLIGADNFAIMQNGAIYQDGFPTYASAWSDYRRLIADTGALGYIYENLEQTSRGLYSVEGEGLIYVIKNPCMPDLIKIGSTVKGRENLRLSELHTTGVPLPFKPIAYFETPTRDCAAMVEKRIHDRLSVFRLNRQREFFKIIGDIYEYGIKLDDALEIVRCETNAHCIIQGSFDVIRTH